MDGASAKPDGCGSLLCLPSWWPCAGVCAGWLCAEQQEARASRLSDGAHRMSQSGYHHLIVQPRPTHGKLRVRFTPDRSRSYARPMHPAEDRPLVAEEPPGALDA